MQRATTTRAEIPSQPSENRNGRSFPSFSFGKKKLPESQTVAQVRSNESSGAIDDVSFLRLPEVKAVTGLSKTSLYALIKERSFPAPVRLGPRAVAWVRSEVRQWALERVHASRSAA
jgi:predicted DNA-binding transcriptional regulator AlpA